MMNFNGRTTLFLCFSLLYLPIFVHPYTPVDLFSINCGSSSNITDSDRSWVGDIGNKISLTETQNKSIVAQSLTQSPSVPQVPYTTARLSHTQFSYSFPVTQGPKFLRLFFYPSSYPGFDRFNSFFTVKANVYTLLKDFNASVTADAYTDETILREYCIYVGDGERLNLTFSANTSSNPDHYAFINGIEIVSMPDYLYYTNPSEHGFKLVGSTTLFSLENSIALENDYRLIAGGTTISPRSDTGMLRSWETDNDYVLSPSALPTDINQDTKLSFTVIPNYTAPDQVYRSSRSMGKNQNANRKSNLTWEFPVDPGFNYMLRLHFCELDPDIDEANNRLFDIYIEDQLAEQGANVLNWGKGKGVPVYRDYAIFITEDSLSLKMHPDPNYIVTSEYSDAFLNGLEIFKISDSNNLAGPNPNPPPQIPPNPDNQPRNRSTKSRKSIVIAVIVAIFIVVFLSTVVLLLLLLSRKKKLKNPKSSDGTSKWAPFSFATTTTKSAANSHGSSLPSDLCRYFTIAEIQAATNNFDEIFTVGGGGFGNVYKGYVDDGQTPVAIKRLKPGSQQGFHEFKTEIEMLSQLRHLHLVSLIGYSNENNEMILVYDFMTRGTLRDHLYNTENPALTWKQRIQICIGAARGLHYLHTGAKHMIIHRDVKTTNILLDEKWIAKVSDFGLSRIGPTNGSKCHVSTVVKGSIGYLDPEYYKRQRLTEKSDVYSFGVVMFEVLCGRPPFIRTAEKRQVSLVDWARHCYKNGTLSQIVDPTLRGKIANECLWKYGEIAVSCLLDDGTQRPSMNDVVWGLEFALQLQENAEKTRKVMEGGEIGNIEENKEGGNNNNNDNNKRKNSSEEISDDGIFSSSSCSGIVSDYFNKSSGVSVRSSTIMENVNEDYIYKESDRLMSGGTVFSEIIDPKGR